MAKGKDATKANFLNRTLWTGDNLDVMRGLNSETIDLIYLDPPFNSNKTYSAPIGSQAAGAAFKDTWTLDDVDLAWHGEIAEANPGLYSVIEAAGIAHGKGMKSYLIMMGVRLMEMRRLLKPTGSLYLHCDPTASHYLKLVMDSVFGPECFMNDVTWKRTSAHSDSGRFGANTDTILFYSKTDAKTWTPQFLAYEKEYVARFRQKDEDGRAWSDYDITAKGLSGGGYEYEYKGVFGLWRVPESTMQNLDSEGKLHFTRTGRIRLKRYLDEMKGRPVQALWDDIPPINSQSKERTGYPTQKPRALLERIIQASSNEDDVILDPFCGCATALVASEYLNRQWIGIDLSPRARDLIRERMEKELGMFSLKTIYREDVPKRTDLGKIPDYKTQKHTLFGQQEGICAGCLVSFPFRNLAIDHKIARAKGGTDHLENLQLLCPACNSKKGTKTQEEFLALLKADGIR